MIHVFKCLKNILKKYQNQRTKIELLSAFTYTQMYRVNVHLTLKI